MEPQVKVSPDKAKSLAQKILESACPLSMATIGKDGFPNVRLLAIGAADGLETIWFSTSVNTEKIAELQANPKVALYGFHQESMGEFRLFGTVELLNDMESRKRVWKEEYKQYWPDGIESPDIMVIKFATQRGSYCGPGQCGTF